MSNGKTDPLDAVIADWRKEAAAMRKIGSEGDAMHRMVHALLASDLESRCDRLAAILPQQVAPRDTCACCGPYCYGSADCKLKDPLKISGAAVPKMPSADLSRCCDIVYAEGWNDCRAEMLADRPAKGGNQ